ncbi:MAG: TRAP transporter large permease subunit [Treponema sp.]|jgi:tripartite ATP-independent transporter DctM subunit|nr:TRAP transporter large permease subunit [Treponema sp.]
MENTAPDKNKPPLTPNSSAGNVLWIIEQSFCYAALALMTLLPVAEAVARAVFHTGVPASSGLLVQLLLAVGIFSGMLTTKKAEHLSISLIQYIPAESRFKRFSLILSGLISAFVTVIIAWTSLSFIKIGLSDRIIGFIPERVAALVLPIGYAVIAFRFARMTPVKGWARLLPVLALVLGSAAAFPSIAKFIWEFDIPDSVYDYIDVFYDLAYYGKIPAAAILIFAAFTGTPLFAVIGGLALVLLQAEGAAMEIVVSQVYAALTKSSIVAIPLFTVTGFLLSESKAGERLLKTFRNFFGWLPGGLIIVTVIICAFFTSFTGASGVTILALGGILYSILSDYPEKFSIGLLTSVGSIGLLFPPSLPIILVGATSQTNIIHMFAGGILPGFILIAAVIVFGIAASIKIKIPREPFHLKNSLRSLKDSAFEIILPIFLIAGYFSGFFSLVEIGAIAVVYVFIVEALVHREIKVSALPQVLLKALPIIGGVLSILALSQALSYYIVDTHAPETLARLMRATVESKYVFLLLLNLSLLVVGCLMDIFSAILIILPLVLPLGQAYGIDPVHLGIIFITNLEVGFLTPPIGLNLFLATYRFKKPFVKICRYVLPFLLIQLVVVLLVTYVPWLSTFLPRFF